MSASPAADQDQEPTRRDFLYIATGAAGGVVTVLGVWPLINQMNPDAATRALAQSEVDVSGVGEGEQLTAVWRGQPVFIRRRTPDEIAEANAVALGDLPDPLARNDNLGDDADASDANRFLQSEEWLVMLGVCTHFGCVPIGDGAGDYNGWYCPCHGSHYDSAGRIRKGPAPENLLVPPAQFIDDTTILIG